MTGLTRREVIRGAGVAAAAVPVTVLLEDPAEAATVALTRASFTKVVGGTLSLRGAYTGRTMRVLRVDDLPHAKKGDQKRFSVRLQMTRGRLPGSGTYTFASAKLGTFRMFVTPVGTKGDLEAVFNAR